MKHDLTLLKAANFREETPDVAPEKMAGCGGRCHAFNCSQDCCLDPYHDGPHRCFNHK